MKKLLRVLCLSLIGALVLAGCVNVKPWQRGALAEEIMQGDRNILVNSMVEHMYFSREAASGGHSVGGGGCGCN